MYAFMTPNKHNQILWKKQNLINKCTIMTSISPISRYLYLYPNPQRKEDIISGAWRIWKIRHWRPTQRLGFPACGGDWRGWCHRPTCRRRKECWWVLCMILVSKKVIDYRGCRCCPVAGDQTWSLEWPLFNKKSDSIIDFFCTYFNLFLTHN